MEWLSVEEPDLLVLGLLVSRDDNKPRRQVGVVAHALAG